MSAFWIGFTVGALASFAGLIVISVAAVAWETLTMLMRRLGFQAYRRGPGDDLSNHLGVRRVRGRWGIYLITWMAKGRPAGRFVSLGRRGWTEDGEGWCRPGLMVGWAPPSR